MRASRAHDARSELRRQLLPSLLLAPALVLMLGLLMLPILSGILYSFQETGRGGDVSFVGLRHYAVLAREPRFLGDVLRLLLYVGCNVSISLVLGYGAAVIITRSMAAAGLFRSLLLLPWITPPVVSAMMFRSMVDPTTGPATALCKWLLGRNVLILGSSTGAMATVIIHSVWRSFPFMMLFLAAGIAAIPRELYEAASVEGCGPMKQFRHVTVPLTKVHAAIVLLIVTMWTLQDTETVYALTEGGPGYATEMVALRLFRESFLNFDIHLGAAVGVVLMVAAAVFAVFYLTFVAGKRVEL